MTDDFVGSVAEHSFGTRVPAHDNALERLADDGIFGRIDNLGQTEPACGSSLALGDIDNGREHHQSFFGLDGVQADLHWKLTAVLAPRIEISPDTHGPGAGLAEKSAAKCRVLSAKSLWNKQLHWLADQIFAPVAE